MAPPATNRIHPYHPSAFKCCTRSSDFGGGGAHRERATSKRNRGNQHAVVARQPKGTSARFWSSFTVLFSGSDRKRAKKLDTPTYSFVPHDQWKAYGPYFPRPAPTRVQVWNSTPQCRPSVTTRPYNARSSLRGTNDLQNRPNRPGAQQPALQPVLRDWVNVPGPITRGIQLDPYLQHRCNGPHPISFDIPRGPNGVTYNSRGSVATPHLDPAYFARPATHPPVMQMRIECVADDPLPHFPWPIEIRNSGGITCGDVFDAISRHFLKYVSGKEYNGWTARRKKLAARAYYARVGIPRDRTRVRNVAGPDDGLRRIDYVGSERVIFRGLEQACVMMDNTWLMYLGSERSKASCFGGNPGNKA